MRIPVPIAIASCFLATGATWYFSTRHADFTTPPSESEKSLVEQQWKQEHTTPLARTPTRTDPPQVAANAPQLIKPKRSKQSLPQLLPTGNLELSPKLTEYGTLGDQGAEAMIHLASTLEQRNARQHALLAWERVIDSTQATPEQIDQASQAIQRLSAELTPWNPDPTAAITITLHVGATLKSKTELVAALKSTAETIEQASGYVLQVKTLTAMGRGKPLERPRVPIAIWASRSGSKSGEANGETPPLSFMATPDQEQELTKQCQSAVYKLVRSHLAETTAFSPLPEMTESDQADHLLRHRITRLMWREFANSLK